MSLLSRLKRLEKSTTAVGCPGCAVRQITHHEEYTLPNGETITLPPIPVLPPCTCGRRKKERRISFIICKHPGIVESREQAERLYAKYAAFHRPWQPDDDRL
jgi:hypothetical protein